MRAGALAIDASVTTDVTRENPESREALEDLDEFMNGY